MEGTIETKSFANGTDNIQAPHGAISTTPYDIADGYSAIPMVHKRYLKITTWRDFKISVEVFCTQGFEIRL